MRRRTNVEGGKEEKKEKENKSRRGKRGEEGGAEEKENKSRRGERRRRRRRIGKGGEKEEGRGEKDVEKGEGGKIRAINLHTLSALRTTYQERRTK